MQGREKEKEVHRAVGANIAIFCLHIKATPIKCCDGYVGKTDMEIENRPKERARKLEDNLHSYKQGGESLYLMQYW